MSEFREPLKRARGLGSAKTGTQHFMVQRVTAVALIFLGAWFVYLTLGLLHADYASARATLAEPLNAVLAIALVIAVFWHAQLGVQVVLEDYVQRTAKQVVYQVLLRFACFFAGAAGVLAVLRIALGS
ncbi:MAG TPA: succinate dehydrogenase, hydrophobic membrane anchor protein [Rhodanobacteraceae bacterium]|nr:succinate dehydrogenase, hydrophobic membrane anchor protein [Rhodanobacteraceae bacterium]